MLTMHSYDAPDFVMCSCVFRPIVTDPKRTEELWISVSQRQAMKEPSLTGQHYIQIRTPAKFSLISAWGDFWLVTRTSHEFSYTNFTTWNYGMSFWANKNSSTILINSREMWKWSGSFLPFNAICSAVDMDQNFMVTQMRVQQQRREGKRREGGEEERIWGREGVGWIHGWGSPLYPGFPPAGWSVSHQQQGHRRVSPESALTCRATATKPTVSQQRSATRGAL